MIRKGETFEAQAFPPGVNCNSMVTNGKRNNGNVNLPAVSIIRPTKIRVTARWVYRFSALTYGYFELVLLNYASMSVKLWQHSE